MYEIFLNDHERHTKLNVREKLKDIGGDDVQLHDTDKERIRSQNTVLHQACVNASAKFKASSFLRTLTD